MRRVAGCLVVSLLASTAAWIGCRPLVGDQSQALLGSDAFGGDAYGGGSGSDAGIRLDAMVMFDAGHDGGTGFDAGTEGASDDAGGSGNPLDPGGGGALQRTSFYACTGGPASASVEVGLPIALALAFAVRRRRRWRA